jgi:hypothetical protein
MNKSVKALQGAPCELHFRFAHLGHESPLEQLQKGLKGAKQP